MRWNGHGNVSLIPNFHGNTTEMGIRFQFANGNEKEWERQ